MKNYTSLEALIKSLKALDGAAKLPDDTFGHRLKICGRIFEQVTYGGPPLNATAYSFVTYRNRRSGETLTIKYDCPTRQGGVQTKVFKYLDCDTY